MRLATHLVHGFVLGAWPKQGEAFLTEYLLDDQSVEIPCARCHRTSPKTIAWIRANDRYRCPGCNTEIVIEQEKLLRDFQRSRM
jgi:transposase-like protein